MERKPLLINKWIPWQTTRGPVEVMVIYRISDDPFDRDPINIKIRRDKDKFVLLPINNWLDKYEDLNQVIEVESEILF